MQPLRLCGLVRHMMAGCVPHTSSNCYMYRAVKRVLERQAARVLYRGEARQTLPPIGEWRRFDAADVQPGLFWCEDLREARRQLMAVGESPKVAISSPAQYCGLDPRAAGGARGAAEVVRGAQPGVPGPAPGRLGARDFFEAAEGEAGGARRGGEAEDPGRAGRQVRAVRLRADDRHLRAGPRGAGEAGLCGQRANFAGAVRRLPQREDAARNHAAHEFGEPRGPRRHGVRPEPQAAPSGF